MAGQVQVVPQSLLGFLQIKSQGENPNRLLTDITPTVDLTEWWRQARIEDTPSLFPGGEPQIVRNTPSAFIQLQSGGVGCVVPPGQWWYVDQLMILIAFGAAADYARFQGAVNTFSAGAPNQWYSVTPEFNDVVTARVRVAQTPPMLRGFWAPPGTQFGVTVFDAATAGNLTFAMNIRAVRLPT